MRISFTGTLEGGRVLYNIGKIEAASAWHPENSEPLQPNWRELILRELIRTAEDIDADAVIGVGQGFLLGLNSTRLAGTRRQWLGTRHDRCHCGVAASWTDRLKASTWSPNCSRVIGSTMATGAVTMRPAACPTEAVAPAVVWRIFSPRLTLEPVRVWPGVKI
jgi:hypothetical protein